MASSLAPVSEVYEMILLDIGTADLKEFKTECLKITRQHNASNQPMPIGWDISISGGIPYISKVLDNIYSKVLPPNSAKISDVVYKKHIREQVDYLQSASVTLLSISAKLAAMFNIYVTQYLKRYIRTVIIQVGISTIAGIYETLLADVCRNQVVIEYLIIALYGRHSSAEVLNRVTRLAFSRLKIKIAAYLDYYILCGAAARVYMMIFSRKGIDYESIGYPYIRVRKDSPNWVELSDCDVEYIDLPDDVRKLIIATSNPFQQYEVPIVKYHSTASNNTSSNNISSNNTSSNNTSSNTTSSNNSVIDINSNHTNNPTTASNSNNTYVVAIVPYATSSTVPSVAPATVLVSDAQEEKKNTSPFNDTNYPSSPPPNPPSSPPPNPPSSPPPNPPSSPPPNPPSSVSDRKSWFSPFKKAEYNEEVIVVSSCYSWADRPMEWESTLAKKTSNQQNGGSSAAISQSNTPFQSSIVDVEDYLV